MNLKIISAGAGSGKTYRLTQEMVGLLAGGKVRASGIIATTFTNKAAAELQERVRVKLLEEGLTREANDLSNALIGTVHGLGVKLLKRFAFEAGVSPEVDIIADEDQQFMFNQSLATVLTNTRVSEMEFLSERLGLKKSQYSSTDWRRVLKELTEVARSNNFSEEVLEKSKVLSFQSFASYLDEVTDRDADAWNNQLLAELEDAITRLENNGDTTKTTANGVKSLKEIRNELKMRDSLYWHQWVKLTKVKVGAKSRDDFEPLAAFANRHLAHAGFHSDIRSFIYNIFDLAREAMQEYSRYKKRRGLIDYTDMEVLVNQLLSNQRVRSTLQEEVDLLMVDEFQDTSPLQLEIFLKLSKIAKHSVWVGDPKQSIYGFRGAEPALMQAIISQQGGLKKENILAYSWRSREDIVYATNALFTRAFDNLPEEQVALAPKRCKKAASQSANKRDEPAEMGKALVHWHFQYAGEGRKPSRRWIDNCIAEQVETLLNRKPVILPKGEKEYRPVRPGDIAILCRSNKKCQDVAGALHQAGLRAAISRTGLLNTAEARLILACLKFILNKYDSLSIAEILILASALELKEVIEDRMAYLNQSKETANTRWGDNDAIIQHLNSLRQEVAELSSAEILTLLLDELELRRIIISWGNNEQRLSNVDRLIKLSFQYEEACNRLHTAASLGGFLLWLSDLENNGDDYQGAGENPQAVNVLTYHKSKGLEYPFVICHSLDQTLREDVWGLTIVPESKEVDLDNLLGNRWLRYWVNPYSDQYKNTLLAERINQSPIKAKKRKEALAEEARLLYVGITRARDFLILPTSHHQPIWLNRVYHNGMEDRPVLDPNSSISPLEWKEEWLPFQVEVIHKTADFTHEQAAEQTFYTLYSPKGRSEHAVYYFDEITNNQPCKAREESYAPAPSLPEVIERQFAGRAVVSYTKAEKSSLAKNDKELLAIELLERFQAEDLLDGSQIDSMENAFRHWVSSRFKVRNQMRQFPVRVFFNGQLFETRVDLVLETETGYQVVLHSPHVGDKRSRLKKVKEMSGRLFAIRQALQQIFGVVTVGLFVHFVLAGTVVEVE